MMIIFILFLSMKDTKNKSRKSSASERLKQLLLLEKWQKEKDDLVLKIVLFFLLISCAFSYGLQVMHKDTKNNLFELNRCLIDRFRFVICSPCPWLQLYRNRLGDVITNEPVCDATIK